MNAVFATNAQSLGSCWPHHISATDMTNSEQIQQDWDTTCRSLREAVQTYFLRWKGANEDHPPPPPWYRVSLFHSDCVIVSCIIVHCHCPLTSWRAHTWSTHPALAGTHFNYYYYYYHWQAPAVVLLHIPCTAAVLPLWPRYTTHLPYLYYNEVRVCL